MNKSSETQKTAFYKEKEAEMLDKAINIIKNSQNIVVFTGAGMSTESGIPDFRSENGLWSRYDPDVYANYYNFLKHPELFWQMENEVKNLLEKSTPHAGHLAIAEFEKTGKLKAIITQNIDFLHQRAGSKVPIYELHGSSQTASCVSCGTSITRTKLLKKMEKQRVPRCDKCGGLIKPDVVLFGESLPYDSFMGAMAACSSCDCIIIIGTSLVVAPANQFPLIAKENGAKVILIDKKPLDTGRSVADVVLKGKAGEIVPKIFRS